jgi:hypothetical protein
MSVQSSPRDSNRLCSMVLIALGVEIGEGDGVYFFWALGIFKYLSPLYFLIYCSKKNREEQER